MEQKTPLYACHEAAHGKIVPFAGYLLPVQYEAGVMAEHMAVRTAAGLFDVSHMGEIICRGKDALANLNHLLTNDFSVMEDGQARYSPMCNEAGGVVDDLIVYKVRDMLYLIVVNAANKEKDYAWMCAHQQGDVVFENISARVAQIALQGPQAPAMLRRLAKEEALPRKYYHCIWESEVGGIGCMVSQTGYTGEPGYELYLANADAPRMWEMLLQAGHKDGLIPCGLGARDTLRLEAGMPLYGHEMDETVSPLEAGLGFAVKMQKPDFIGKAALAAGAPARRRVGLWVTGKGIIREQAPVFLNERAIGRSTSGTHCPYLGRPAAMALLEAGCAQVGTKVWAEVRGRKIEAEITALPFYQKNKKEK